MKAKRILLLVLLIISIGFPIYVFSQNKNDQQKNDFEKRSKSKKQTYLINGKILQRSIYCGGARPTQDKIDQMAIPVAYEGKILYIKKGKINNTKSKIIKSITADKEGNFSIRLPKGIYSIIVEEQLKEIKEGDFVTQNQKVDINCLKEWWAKPYYVLEVRDKNIELEDFVFQHKCFVTHDIPCLTYTGPMPP